MSVLLVYGDLPDRLDVERRDSESMRDDLLVVHDPSRSTVLGIADRIMNGHVTSAALLADMPPDDELWVAREWFHRFVVDRGLPEADLLREHGWTRSADFQELVVLEPAQPDGAALQLVDLGVFRREIDSAMRLGTRVPLDPSTHLRVDLFGEYVPSGLGGSAALLSLSGATPDRPDVVLRNLRALELARLDEVGTLTAHRREGSVVCRAIGLSSGDELDTSVFEDPRACRLAWQERRPSPAEFWVLVELSAPVDPAVWIPVGQVFEQRGVNRRQTLAVATPTRTVVTPGQLTTTALPAWCLNQRLSPPDGRPVDPTPLRTRYTEAMSQRAVWADRSRIEAGV